MVLTFEVASETDINTITTLINEAFVAEAFLKYSPNRLEECDVRQRFQTGVFIFGVIEGQRVACMYVEQHPSHLYLGLLSVACKHQGKGIGKHMMEEAERIAKREKVPMIQLRAVNLRWPMIQWYTRCGYIIADFLKWKEFLGSDDDIRPQYRGRIGLVVMEKRLCEEADVVHQT